MGQNWDQYADQPQASKWDQYADSQPSQTATPTSYPQTLIPHGATISADHTPWLQKLESDVRTGGTSTLPGRLLHALGARGTDTATTPAAADMVASIPLGAIKTAQGITEAATPNNPDKLATVGKLIGGPLQMATLPAAFASPEAGQAVVNKVPSVAKESGTALLSSVEAQAAKVPVALQNAQQGALELMNWQQKTNLGPTLNKFLNRITSPTKGPLTFDEAREYYKLLGRLSAEENSKLAPAVQRSLAQMMNGLKVDIGNAASQVGRGEDYYRALAQTRYGYQGQKIADDAVQALKQHALQIGAGAAGGGLTVYALQKLLGNR